MIEIGKSGFLGGLQIPPRGGLQIKRKRGPVVPPGPVFHPWGTEFDSSWEGSTQNKADVSSYFGAWGVGGTQSIVDSKFRIRVTKPFTSGFGGRLAFIGKSLSGLPRPYTIDVAISAIRTGGSTHSNSLVLAWICLVKAGAACGMGMQGWRPNLAPSANDWRGIVTPGGSPVGGHHTMYAHGGRGIWRMEHPATGTTINFFESNDGGDTFVSRGSHNYNTYNNMLNPDFFLLCLKATGEDNQYPWIELDIDYIRAKEL